MTEQEMNDEIGKAIAVRNEALSALVLMVEGQ